MRIKLYKLIDENTEGRLQPYLVNKKSSRNTLRVTEVNHHRFLNLPNALS